MQSQLYYTAICCLNPNYGEYLFLEKYNHKYKTILFSENKNIKQRKKST